MIKKENETKEITEVLQRLLDFKIEESKRLPDEVYTFSIRTC